MFSNYFKNININHAEFILCSSEPQDSQSVGGLILNTVQTFHTWKCARMIFQRLRLRMHPTTLRVRPRCSADRNADNALDS